MPNQYLRPVIQIPSSLLITAITQTSPMQVTTLIGDPTTEANTYVVGMAVRLFVPMVYGMFQANNLVGTIIAINSSIFTLAIDSTQFDPFVYPVAPSPIVQMTPASLSPAGSRNLQYDNTNINQIPFQSLNNIGN